MPDQIRTDEQYRAAREMLCEWTKDIEGIPYLLGVPLGDMDPEMLLMAAKHIGQQLCAEQERNRRNLDFFSDILRNR